MAKEYIWSKIFYVSSNFFCVIDCNYLIIFSFFYKKIFFKLTGNPLTCQVPPEKKEFTKYILTLCYINKSYYWPENKAFDGNTFPYSSRSIKYYPFFAVVYFLCWLILAIPSRCWVVAMSRAEFSPLHLMPILRMAEKKKDFRTAFNVSKSAGITMKKWLLTKKSSFNIWICKYCTMTPNFFLPFPTGKLINFTV